MPVFSWSKSRVLNSEAAELLVILLDCLLELLGQHLVIRVPLPSVRALQPYTEQRVSGHCFVVYNSVLFVC